MKESRVTKVKLLNTKWGVGVYLMTKDSSRVNPFMFNCVQVETFSTSKQSVLFLRSFERN